MAHKTLWVSLLTISALGWSGCSEKRSPTTLPPAHPARWMDVASADFHGKVVDQRGPTSCQTCHGADYRGGDVRVSCVECHQSSSGACLSCHGGVGSQSPAPPRGLRGETANTTLAVGAHASHRAGTVISDGVPCENCHIVPALAFDSLHLDLAGGAVPDSVAEITWGDIAGAPGITWNRGTATCSGTYCHGNFSGGDQANAPIWTAANQALCGSCHDVGSAPATLGWKHDYHAGQAGLQCADCHANVVDTLENILSLSRHVNGVVDTTTRDIRVCNTCHGSGPVACTSCHGGVDNSTGAPPDGLRGETSRNTLAVGAHTAHMEGGNLADAFACSECHVRPNSLLQSGHLGADSVAEITWGGIAPAPGIAWNRGAATCANTYCHGNFSGGLGAVATWTASTAVACGTCHDAGSNPSTLSGEHEKHVDGESLGCYRCHAGTVNSSLTITGRTLHVNGAREVVFSSGQGTWNGTDCTNVGCHGRESWR